jgi:hypothetical protein
MDNPAVASKSEAAILARALVDLRDRQIQKARIQFGNRLAAIENGMDETPYRAYIERWFNRFGEIEADLDQSISDLAEDFPIIERMTRVKGVGKTLAMKTAVMIDIRRADTISSLWRYAGYAVIDGQRERPTKGEKLHYNSRLKTTCYLIGSSFLKSSSPYRVIYDNAKEHYQETHPDWTKLHIHNASMRKMIKIWLAHLWIVWREMEGLPVTQPWIADESSHHRIYEPEEFGW